MAQKTTNRTNRTQVEILASTPSALFLASSVRHAGVHADQNRKDDPRSRRRENRQEERSARYGWRE